MIKIWFSIEMTFNTSLFVSLLFLLILLPNAKCVPTKKMTPPKNNTLGKSNATKSVLQRQFSRFAGKQVRPASNSTKEKVAGIFDYPEEDPEDDVMVRLNEASIDSSKSTKRSSTETTTYHDYEINSEEYKATEPPEMDTLAELVDENGQVEAEDKEEHEDTTTTQSTESTITTISSNFSNTTVNMSSTTKFKKFAELFMPDTSALKTKLTQIIHHSQIEKNQTERARKKTCLEYSQDSGFWCKGIVNKLEIKYYYNKDSESCDCFIYYGCLGNKNKFDSIKECEDNCKQFAIHGIKKSPLNDCSSILP